MNRNSNTNTKISIDFLVYTVQYVIVCIYYSNMCCSCLKLTPALHWMLTVLGAVFEGGQYPSLLWHSHKDCSFPLHS